MDSKVQKAVYSVIDQLLVKIEDRCDVPKTKLWELWRTMFNFPEEAKPRVKKEKSEPKKASPPTTEPVAKSPVVAAAKSPVAEAAKSPVVAAVKSPVVAAAGKSPVVEEVKSPVEDVVKVVEKSPSKIVSIEDDEDDIPLVRSATKVVEKEVKQESPRAEGKDQSKACCFVLTKGARKGQQCGEQVAKKYQEIGMCTIHGKKN